MALPDLRAIFASSRTSEESYELSRQTFSKFAGFAISCAVISLLAHSRAAKASLMAGP